LVGCGIKGADIKAALARSGGGVALYSGGDNHYYMDTAGDYKSVMRAVLTAPWVHRNIDNFRLNFRILDPSGDGYNAEVCNVSRYELAPWFGKLLLDGGKAARYAGFGAAVVDACYWLRELLSNCGGFGVPALPLLYLLVGLLVGVLLYGLGLLMEYLFDRWYGYTPAAEVVGAAS
jgi:hypothetical protein